MSRGPSVGTVCMWAAGFNNGLLTFQSSCTFRSNSTRGGSGGSFLIPARVEVSLLSIKPKGL